MEKPFKSKFLNEQFANGNIIERMSGFDIVWVYEKPENDFFNTPIPADMTRDKFRNKISAALRYEGYSYEKGRGYIKN